MIVVTREPWSIENGFLTPTMKVRRARIEKSMEAHVDALVRDRSARALALTRVRHGSSAPPRAPRR